MAREKVKLAWIVNDNARKASLKKRRLGLVKKVNELSILCDLKACLIIFSPDEAEPLVCPSPEVARVLIDRFFALPDVERNKKSLNLESYMRKRVEKLQKQVVKIQKKQREAEIDKLMYLHQHGRRLSELQSNEINELTLYCEGKIDLLRKRLEIIQHSSPLDIPPKMKEDAFSCISAVAPMASGGEASSSGVRKKPVIWESHQNKYLMDQWFVHTGANNNTAYKALATPVTGPGIHQQLGIGMMPYHENPYYYVNLRPTGLPFHPYERFLGTQASNASANPNREMELMRSHRPSRGSFLGLFSQAIQPTHHGAMNMNHGPGNLMNIRGEIHMAGLGFQSQGSRAGHQVLPLVGRKLNLIPHGREEASTMRGTNSRWLGPHGYGESMAAPFDISKNWPKNKDYSSQ